MKLFQTFTCGTDKLGHDEENRNLDIVEKSFETAEGAQEWKFVFSNTTFHGFPVHVELAYVSNVRGNAGLSVSKRGRRGGFRI